MPRNRDESREVQREAPKEKSREEQRPAEAAPQDEKAHSASEGGESPKSHVDLNAPKNSGPKIADPYEGANIGQYDPEPELKKLQDNADAVHNVGFYGYNVDPTPNENYTVAGVTQGKPNPQTHDMRDAVLARQQEATRLTSPNPDKDGTVPGGDTPPRG